MADRQRWRPVLYDCPQTGHKVQALLAEEAGADEARYETINCLACSGVHFVDARGRVLGTGRDGFKR